MDKNVFSFISLLLTNFFFFLFLVFMNYLWWQQFHGSIFSPVVNDIEHSQKFREHEYEVTRKDGLVFLREMAAEVKNFMDFKMNAVMVSFNLNKSIWMISNVQRGFKSISKKFTHNFPVFHLNKISSIVCSHDFMFDKEFSLSTFLRFPCRIWSLF